MWRTWLLSCWLLAQALPAAAGGPDPQALAFSISPRTPEQLTAFYSARGFSPAMVAAIIHACFLTVGLTNHSRQVVWLEPARWRFETADGRPVRRIDRAEWERAWEALGVPPAHRATFGWTQLPESRDLRPGEPVGGNVTVEPPAGPFRLTAVFRTGERGEGPPLVLRVENLTCPAGGGP